MSAVEVLMEQLRDRGLTEDQMADLMWLELVHREAWEEMIEVARAIIAQRDATL
jgi:hypothetical protein